MYVQIGHRQWQFGFIRLNSNHTEALVTGPKAATGAKRSGCGLFFLKITQQLLGYCCDC